MIFYFKANGEPIGSIVERTFCGAVNAVGTYFACPISSNLVVSVAYTLPDATTTAKLPMQSVLDSSMQFVDGGVKFNFWRIDTPSVVTEKSGIVRVQFFISNVDGGIVSTSRCVFEVEEGVNVTPIEDNASYDEIATVISSLNAIIGSMGNAATQEYVNTEIEDKCGKVNYSNTVNDIPIVMVEGNETYFNEPVNSIVFNPQPASKIGKHFYIVFKSGETPTTITFGESEYFVCDEIVPLANHIVEISGIWNGEKWIVASKQTAVN